VAVDEVLEWVIWVLGRVGELGEARDIDLAWPLMVRTVPDRIQRLAAPRQPDTKIAQAWLRAHAAEYDSVEFNVRLGQGIVLPETADPSMKLFAQAVSTKKADIVLKKGAAVTIVEIKIRVGGAALGQLQLYRHLYLAEHPAAENVRLIVAAQYLEPDVADVYRAHDVAIELFPAALAA